MVTQTESSSSLLSALMLSKHHVGTDWYVQNTYIRTKSRIRIRSKIGLTGHRRGGLHLPHFRRDSPHLLSYVYCLDLQDMTDPALGLRQRQTMLKDEKAELNPIPRRKKPAQGETTSQSILHLIPLFGLLGVLYYLLNRNSSPRGHSREARVRELQEAYAEKLGGGHWDFGDGRTGEVGEIWREGCEGCYWVNTMLGNGG